MDKFIGTKIILATPMSKKTFGLKNGNDVEDCDDQAGYLVKYSVTYESWSPKNEGESLHG